MRDEYLKFLGEEIDVSAGRYTRAELIAIATAPPAPAVRVAKVTATASVVSGKVDEKTKVLLALGDAKFVTGDDPPKGAPSIRHLFAVLSWIRDKTKHTKALCAALDDAKNLNDVADVVGRMPVYDSARWLFTAMRGHVTPSALATAFTGNEPGPLVDELLAWGLTIDGVKDGSECFKQAELHQFILPIIKGEREDGVYKTPGSAAAVMKALRAVYDALGDEQRDKMYNHIIKTYDSDRVKAMAPMMKVMNAKGHGEVGSLICALLVKGDVPVAVLAMVFQDVWDRLYSSLLSCLDTQGPRPPWLNQKAA